MSEKGVHYLLHAGIKGRLVANSAEYERVSAELQEAIALGDLRENAEYDAAKDAMRKVTNERDMLQPYLSLPQVRANDSASIFEEGCVIRLRVFNTTPEPMSPKSEAFLKLIQETVPVFEGIVMLGGTLPIHELLRDSALAVDTPIGKYLLGKQSGCYSVQVPGGFANIEAYKLKSTDFKPEEICCVYRG